MRTVALACLTATVCAFVPYPTPAATERYHVIELPSLGGASRANSINNEGVVSGYARPADNASEVAAAWLFGQLVKVGTLGGPNSDVAWPVKSNIGRVAGISQTAAPEVLGEHWSCSAFFAPATSTGFVCRGFVNAFGVMHELPTLGGENSYAAGDNRLGRIAGWAETSLRDPTCEGPGTASGQILQFLPVIYGPSPSHIETLPLIGGDSSGAATAINDRGQAVGISGDCDQAVGRKTARHAVLWEHGRIIDMGNGQLPAAWWNTPTAINDWGVVVGFLGDPRDVTGNITHAFIWTPRTGIQRLVPGDYSTNDTDNSTATGINNLGQVVGYYLAADNQLHGFAWDRERGLQDLNDLKQPDYMKLVQLANDINDRGQIAGRAFDPVTNSRVAILINPTDLE